MAILKLLMSLRKPKGPSYFSSIFWKSAASSRRRMSEMARWMRCDYGMD
jgi:hypothetical protein